MWRFCLKWWGYMHSYKVSLSTIFWCLMVCNRKNINVWGVRFGMLLFGFCGRIETKLSSQTKSKMQLRCSNLFSFFRGNGLQISCSFCTLSHVGVVTQVHVGTHTVPHSIARDAIYSLLHSLVYHSLFSSKELHTYTLEIALETEKMIEWIILFIKMYVCPFIQAKQSNNPSHLG